MWINYDLENSPLQIKTDRPLGSDEGVKVWFSNAGGDYAGGVIFTFPSMYQLVSCSSSRTDFPNGLPTERDKIWTISLTRASGTVRVIIHCNNFEVLNVVLSDTTCGYSRWSEMWSRNVEKIFFPSYDKASEFYRSGNK